MLAGAPDAAGFATGLVAGFEPAFPALDVLRVDRGAVVTRRVEAGLAVVAPVAGAADDPREAAEAALDGAVGFRPAGLAAADLVVAGFLVVVGLLVAVGFAAAAGFAAVDADLRRFAVVAAAAVAFGAAVLGAAFFAAGFAGGVTDVRTGVTAWLAWAAADPTRRAAADAAPVTVPAADPAAEVASAATWDARDATSLSAAAA